MDQFRQVGEVLGGLKALMVLKHEISINQRQCRLLYDMLALAFDTISEEIKQNLKLDDRTTKWKALELPMKELHKVFKDADLYIRHCMDTTKDWWGRAISLHMNRDCVELHVHNLLCCFPVVIEAIETAAEISGLDQDDMQKRRVAIMQKYDPECDDPKLFLWKFGRQYLVPQEICGRLETAWREDRWLLLEKAGKKKTAVAKLLIRKLNDVSNNTLLPSSVLVGASDYFVRRRLGSGYPSGGGHLKEIHWLGENFALRTFYGDITPLQSDISLVLSLSHPNVLQYLCAFYDEDKKEGFLVMELMSKDLGSYIKEHSGQRNRLPFTIPVAVDIMLQIARGMEFLHSKKIYLGDLNPSNILLKAKNASMGGFQVKVTGFGMTSVERSSPSKGAKPTAPPADLNIWLAPEVLAELDHSKSKPAANYTEKADVYSFGMLCFELLTGKVPFEDGHLQGEKMVRNIRAGERPLFSYPSPKYLQNLTRKCWQTNPDQRPSFSSICRILRYIKKNLAINPNHGDPESPPPLVDYCDMEAGYLKKFPGENGIVPPVSQIPFQMFTYTVFEKEKVCGQKWDPANEGSTHRRMSMFNDEHMAAMDDLFLVPSDRRSVCSEIINTKNSAIAVDMRSVISEIPHRKLHQFEQRSIGSESPGKRFSGGVADQRAFGSLTPERKNVTMMADQKSPIIIPAVENKTTDQHIISQPTVSPRPQEHVKSALTKTTEQKVENREILEVKHSLRSIVEHKQTSSSEPSEGKLLSRGPTSTKLPEIPEKKILQDNGESNQKNVSASSSTTSEKKAEPTAKSDQKLDDSDNSAKKPTLLRKLKDLKIKRSSG
ncbi:light-sensor protein kinase [Phtheirospermum japonicum]|uniref:Light-sensor protein kinase n=1 Tax=Phtheirospermum japonicum TaxID=374723 RepID=A0A830BH70_9LAMI|nr:light-sensor protein kinase [Phtheirospermum japonicum]